MNRGPRIFIAIIVTLIIAAGAIKFTKAPPEAYIPPPNLYQNATQYAHGWVTGFMTTTYGEHLFEGSEDFHFISYKFQPKQLNGITYAENHTQGKLVQQANAPWYTGTVRIDSTRFGPDAMNPYKVGDEITVKYDPLNPNISGVPGSKGVWSKTTGYLNPYLWWYVAFAAVVFVIQEIIRMATKTNDL